MSTAGDLNLGKKLDRWAWVLTVVILLTVGLMRRFKLDTPFDFSFLPMAHALLNSLTAAVLIMAYIHIRRRRIFLHRRWMIRAMLLSLLFLISYVIYHLTTPETLYCKEGIIRYVYFFFLITHIILAAVIFPFVLFTFIRGYTMQVEAHRRLAHWVYWVWLYVTVTGPVCFWMLYPCYP